MLTTPIPKPPETHDGAPTILIASSKAGRKRIMTFGNCFSVVVIAIALLIVSPVILGIAGDMIENMTADIKSRYVTNQDRADARSTLKHFYDSLETGKFAEAYADLDKNAFSDYDAAALERAWATLMAAVGPVKTEFQMDFSKDSIANAVHIVVTIEPIDGSRRNTLDVILRRINGYWKIVESSPMLIPW